MSTDTFSRTGQLDTSERARAAVAEFRRMLPSLNAYAKALTGKPEVQIQMSGHDNGSTDGQKIYFRPPIELGDSLRHDRTLCDRRDPETGQQRCNACRVREDILAVIYHELAHITCDTTVEPTASEITKALNTGFASVPDSEWAQAKRKAVEDAPYYMRRSWLQLAAPISSYLPLLVNAIEDARVNHAMFSARRGVKEMFEVMVQRVFTEGFEASDGMGGVRTVRWNEQPINAQVTVAVFCHLSGYAYQDWFAPEVIEALADPQLKGIMSKMSTVRSVSAVYSLSIPILVRLRELGFFLEPDERESEPEPEPEPEESDTPEPDDADEPDDSDELDPESGGDEDQGDPEAGEDSSGNEGESDDEGDAEQGSGDEESDDPADGEESSAESDPSAEGEDDRGGTPRDSSADDGQSEPSDGADDEDDSGEGGVSSGGESFGDEPDDDNTPEDSDTGGSDELGDTEGNKGSAGGNAGTPSFGEGDTDSDAPGSEEGASDEAAPEQSDPVADDDEVIDPHSVDPEDEDEFGVKLIENRANDDKPIEYGEPDEIEPVMLKFGQHEPKPTHVVEDEEVAEAIETAIVQGIYFETESRNVRGVEIFEYENRYKDNLPVYNGWAESSYTWDARHVDLSIPEQVLGKAVLKSRVVFEENERAKHLPNLKSGRVNARALGKRVPADDERMFRRKLKPGKRSYHVVIGLDISGSTRGPNILLMKRAVAAQAEMLARLGVDFAIYAHSAEYHDPGVGRSAGVDLHIYPIKHANQRWDVHARERLQALGPSSANLDGHALEYLRKRADESTATHKIVLYYSDGKMPAENHDEELVILQREIRTCRRKGYTLLGVGINTDSPREHGLDTVEVNDPDDLIKVVRHLDKKLLNQ